jgi:NitT/TauT family transport system substrate-binding protein
MKKYISIGLIILLVISMSLLSACTTKAEETKKIVIAEQFGLAYAPLQIMQERGYLDEALPEYEIEWVRLGNTAAIREAILADALDVGFLGIPPFLIGYENGMEWGIFTGLSSAPLGLVSNNPEINRLEDISPEDRIALPQPGSIQHILLSMAAERSFGQADYFDDQLVTMKHPDGMSALIAGNEVSLHYTSPPFLFEELARDDMSLVIDGNTCFGDDFTFIVGMTTKEFKEDMVAYDALVESVVKAIVFMNKSPEETLDILEKHYDYDRETLKKYVYDSGMVYTPDLMGVEEFIDFMTRNDLLTGSIKTEEVLW